MEYPIEVIEELILGLKQDLADLLDKRYVFQSHESMMFPPLF